MRQDLGDVCDVSDSPAPRSERTRQHQLRDALQNAGVSERLRHAILNSSLVLRLEDIFAMLRDGNLTSALSQLARKLDRSHITNADTTDQNFAVTASAILTEQRCAVEHCNPETVACIAAALPQKTTHPCQHD